MLERLLALATKKYVTSPPENKLFYTLLIYFLIFSLKFFNILKSAKNKYTFSLSTINARKRKLFKLLKLRFKRKRQRHKTSLFFSLKSKLKYFSLGIFFATVFVYIPLLALIFLQDLPNPQELSLQQIPQTTKIYDRNKVLLYEIYTDQNRTLVSLKDIPNHLQLATLAIEDKNFYKHPGFDITSIIRALKENIMDGSNIQGGSTITQQLIKSSFFTSEKKVSRKIKEIVLAYWTEHIYTKNQILEMYFNQVPYGGTAWGIEAASEVYFGKHVKQLTLAESAFLAGLVQAPTFYSPYAENPTLWKNRQKEVLKRMVALRHITKKQAADAEKVNLRFKQPKAPLLAPHFVMYIRDLLVRKHGLAAVERGGLRVITSLDIKKQELAEKTVEEEVANNAYLNLTNGALLITDPKNGDIISMVGSKNYFDDKGGNVNIATSPQQPGSTVKVITYSAALLKGMTPASLIDDSPSVFTGDGVSAYKPVNYDGKYFGRVNLRFALANSLNLPAVKTLQRVGINEMISLAQKMGVTSWTDPSAYGLSVTLGGAETTMLDMAKAFGTLSNNGMQVDLEPILLITDSKGNILEQKRENSGKRALPEGIAFIISDILSDNQTRSAVFGSNSKLVIPGHKVAVKTGTTDDKRDNWAIGYTKDYVVTVWVGNNDNSPMHPTLASGITGAAPIWHTVMVNLLGTRKDTIQKPPSDIVTKFCFGKMEYFYKGTEQSVNCGINPRAKFYSAQ